MKIKAIYAIIFVNILAKGEADTRGEKNNDTSINDLEAENVETENHENHRRLATIHSDAQDFDDPEMMQDQPKSNPYNHDKILKFGKRILVSVNKHGILEGEADLLRSGNYRIDWWKSDRRLDKIRRRLSEEIARKPELKHYLSALGWRNTSDKVLHEKNSHSDRAIVKKPATRSKNNSNMYGTMMTAFKDLLNFDSTKFDEETVVDEPNIFVFMKIVIPRPKKNDRYEVPAVNEMSDSPMKFTLDTQEKQDLEPSDVESNDIKAEDTPIPNSFNLPTPSMINSNGQSINGDCLLQLIPLIVDELRNDCMRDDERRALSWIFGKRLWQLLEREASKKPDETMDKDLAMFLLKGELIDRDSEMAKRKRRRPARSTIAELGKNKVVERSIIDQDYTENKWDIDYDFEFLDKINDEKTAEKNWNRDGDDEGVENGDGMSVEELLDAAAKYKTPLLENRRRVK